MAYPRPKLASADIEWLKQLGASGRNREDILRLTEIKFGHVWGADVTLLVDALLEGILESLDDSNDAVQAITQALAAIADTAQIQDGAPSPSSLKSG